MGAEAPGAAARIQNICQAPERGFGIQSSTAALDETSQEAHSKLSSRNVFEFARGLEFLLNSIYSKTYMYINGL